MTRGVFQSRRLEPARKYRHSRLPALLAAAILITITGCGHTAAPREATPNTLSQSFIRGEVVEVDRDAPAESQPGDLGVVLVEGARSSPVEEAQLTVTGNSRIIDRRGGGDRAATLDSVSESQTVEAHFEVVSSSPEPWRAEVVDLVICP
jgi:hypothetical protein